MARRRRKIKTWQIPRRSEQLNVWLFRAELETIETAARLSRQRRTSWARGVLLRAAADETQATRQAPDGHPA